MESVEQVGRRERFLQSTFESLSGGDLAHFFKKTFYLFWALTISAGEELSPNSANSNSISAQQRNAGTIGEEVLTSGLSLMPIVWSRWSTFSSQDNNVFELIELFHSRRPTNPRRGSEPASRRTPAENRGDSAETSEREYFIVQPTSQYQPPLHLPTALSSVSLFSLITQWQSMMALLLRVKLTSRRKMIIRHDQTWL